MNVNIKEIIWFFGPIIIALLITLLFFGLKSFTSDKIVINIRDTYYVISRLLFYVTLTVVLGFVIFIIRGIALSFQNTGCNTSLGFYTVMLAILITSSLCKLKI